MYQAINVNLIFFQTCCSTYQNINDAGSVKNIGQYAINALRIDAGVPEMGADIGPFSSPASFGSFSFVNPSKVSLQPYLLQFYFLSNIMIAFLAFGNM